MDADQTDPQNVQTALLFMLLTAPSGDDPSPEILATAWAIIKGLQESDFETMAESAHAASVMASLFNLSVIPTREFLGMVASGEMWRGIQDAHDEEDDCLIH